MRSTAVTFSLSFPAARRRLLDTTAVAFSGQLTAALLAVLPSSLSSTNLLIGATDAAKLHWSITVVCDSPVVVQDVVAATTFIPSLENAIGGTVALETPPAIVVRQTPVPSPPPSPPPPMSPPYIPEPPFSPPASPPSPPPRHPPTPPMEAYEAGLTHEAQSAVPAEQGATLSHEMLWVIIIAVIMTILVLFCAALYYCGVKSKRHPFIARTSSPDDIVGRPQSFRRPPAHYPPGTDNNQPINPDLEGTLLATPPQRAADATNPMTLIELGMSLERQRSAERSPARGTTPPQNDGVQQALALINEVRGLAESLSPRQSRSPPAPRGPLATASSSRAIINPAQQPGRVSPREEPRLSFEGDEDSRI